MNQQTNQRIMKKKKKKKKNKELLSCKVSTYISKRCLFCKYSTVHRVSTGTVVSYLMENGEWRMEDGRWKMEDGRWEWE